MTIRYKSGDMFSELTEAVVNTVNCVGVMGKGVALEFKRRWPENYKQYRKLCDSKLLKPGQMFVYENPDMFGQSGPRFLINFPTKQHWRSKSKLSYVEDGLDEFLRQVKKLGITSVAMPPLGCGNGGLEWGEVKKLLEKKLAALPEVEFIIFPPREEFEKAEHSSAPAGMTRERAILVRVIGDFEKYFGGHLTRLSVQKITYFLQVLGIEFNVQFLKNQFGPYSEMLHTALRIMEDQSYISGYTDENRAIRATHGAYASADEFLQNDASHIEIIDKLSKLIEGYESPYGMELLASVHFLGTTEGITTQPEMSEALCRWNSHKKDTFSNEAVTVALGRLVEDGLLN